ncbi:hypothetical protein BDW02DRAFT_577546 [Decorospora gaudefroyi]|uniref:Uncharacterized protein n=1 Tax=Decorospora gaudefroyi TaxID=184978 RepID=A0A6A5KMC6_9PLEO|nr:hypothetical protein BDW02DRAFT_577546 [Decorospora gaudefroyi]
MGVPARPARAATPPYPMGYFLCDRLADAKTLKSVLALDRLPKLRKARIFGYRRASGDSIVAYDGYNFGEWSEEDCVKGVCFEVFDEGEAQRLLEYVTSGGECEVRTVEMDVQCPSLLGKVGKVTNVQGQVFVQDGKADTVAGGGSIWGQRMERSTEFFDMVAPSGAGSVAAAADDTQTEHEGSDDDSMIATGHPTPQISPSASLIDDSETKHEPLESTDPDEMKTTCNQYAPMEAGIKFAEEQVGGNIEDATSSTPRRQDLKNMPAETANCNTAAIPTSEEKESSTPKAQPWQPTVAWSKENAIRPIRSPLTPTPSNKSSGSGRSCKTSESIKSLVEKFENLSKTVSNDTITSEKTT